MFPVFLSLRTAGERTTSLGEDEDNREERFGSQVGFARMKNNKTAVTKTAWVLKTKYPFRLLIGIFKYGMLVNLFLHFDPRKLSKLKIFTCSAVATCISVSIFIYSRQF